MPIKAKPWKMNLILHGKNGGYIDQPRQIPVLKIYQMTYNLAVAA